MSQPLTRRERLLLRTGAAVWACALGAGAFLVVALIPWLPVLLRATPWWLAGVGGIAATVTAAVAWTGRE